MPADLPPWATPAPSLPAWAAPITPTKTRRRLAVAEYAMVFPRVLDDVASGMALAESLRQLQFEVDQGGFTAWMKKDPERWSLYKNAKELRSEAWAGELLRHAKGEVMDGDMPEDIGRSKLIIDTYKFLMGADNRKDYGDTKSIQVEQTISITSALAQAQSRVSQVIDVDALVGNEIRQLPAPIDVDPEDE